MSSITAQAVARDLRARLAADGILRKDVAARLGISPQAFSRRIAGTQRYVEVGDDAMRAAVLAVA